MPTQNLHIVGGNIGGYEFDDGSPGIKIIAGGFPIDQDADGVMEGFSRRTIVLDLSEMLGYRLGKQIPMTANFRVNYLSIGLRNVNDGNDNDGPNYFAGDWEWYTPTKHRVDAVQAWRQLEKRIEEHDSDQEGIFVSSEDRYKGFRYGWTHSEEQVQHVTMGAPGELPNGYNLVDMLTTYNAGLNQGTPSQSNAIWDRKVGRSSHLGWSAVCENGEFRDGPLLDNDNFDTANIRDFQWTAPHGHAIEVMGGLLIINVTHSSVDNIQNIDDDFDLHIDVGVSGWSSW